MNYAVKYVSPTLLSTLILVEPLFASVMAFFLFAELPPITSIIAMIVILASGLPGNGDRVISSSDSGLSLIGKVIHSSDFNFKTRMMFWDGRDRS
ncbi:MAG: hypothetical protein U5J63_17900 [Fodinibius sp.]|nr:hypothetical protein [Fodinibius sp.]